MLVIHEFRPELEDDWLNYWGDDLLFDEMVFWTQTVRTLATQVKLKILSYIQLFNKKELSVKDESEDMFDVL